MDQNSKYHLGVDLGLKMGLARLYSDRVETYSPRLENDYMGRMLSLRHILQEHLSDDCLGVSIEKPFGKFKGMDVMQGMLAVACLTCEDARVPWTTVHLMSVKKHATGSGKADKKAMQDAAYKRWGVRVGEDESDALHHIAYALDNKLFDEEGA